MNDFTEQGISPGASASRWMAFASTAARTIDASIHIACVLAELGHIAKLEGKPCPLVRCEYEDECPVDLAMALYPDPATFGLDEAPTGEHDRVPRSR